MRLLEPLNGVKYGVGHYATHLIFFLSMCLIDPDININLRENNSVVSTIETV